MWIVLCIPLMAVSVIVAVAPVLGGTIHHHRGERAHRAAVEDGVGAALPENAQPELSVKCPLCASSLGASSDAGLVDVVRRHAWRQHGIPSQTHILESARAT